MQISWLLYSVASRTVIGAGVERGLKVATLDLKEGRLSAAEAVSLP